MRWTLTGLTASDGALRRVSGAWFLVNLAEWAYITAVAIHEFRTHGALALGLIGARFAPGAVIGSLLVGALIRRRPPLVLQLLSLTRCVSVVGVGAAIAVHAPLALLVAIIWIDAVIAAPYRPVQATILPALAKTPRELSAVAGGVPASKALAQAAGALTGSIALAATSAQAVVAGAVTVFLVAAGLVAGIRTEAASVREAGAGSARAGKETRRLGMIGGGFMLIAERARPLLILGVTRSLTRGVWTSLTVVVSLRLLHLGSAGVGILMAAGGIGALVALPLALRFAGRGGLALPGALSFAFAGLPLLLIGAIASPDAAIPLVVVWGVSFALADSISNALIHRVVDAQRLAPSIAALEYSKQMLEGLGALAAPGLLALVGVRWAIIAAGTPLPLMVAFSRRPLRAIDREAGDRGRPLSALRRTPSFQGLTMLSLESLAARLRECSAASGEVIVRQGEPGDRFYLIESGRVEVSVDGFSVAVIGPGGSFGEKAMLRDTPRSATVTALESSAMWFLEAADFIAAATGSESSAARLPPRSRAATVEDVLAAVPLFGGIDRRGLAARGQIEEVRTGVAIVTEGESGHRFYVLLEGEAEVTIAGRAIRTLVAGDCFGEISLLHNVTRTATVTAMGQARLWTLERDVFLAILGESAPAGRGAGTTRRSLSGTDLGFAGAGLIV